MFTRSGSDDAATPGFEIADVSTVPDAMKADPIEWLLEPRQEVATSGWSLRRRLMLMTIVGTVAAWLVGAIVVMFVSRQESENLHIARLQDFARVVLRFAEHEIEEIRADRPGDIIHVETSLTLDPRFRYQVRDNQGQLVLVSFNTSHEPFVPLDNFGHQEVEVDGVEHYVYSLWNDDHTLQIQVIERAEHSPVMLASFGGELGAGFLLTVLGLIAVKAWLTRRATRALDQTASQLVNRSPGDLGPIVADNPPSELVPILKAINCLFARIRSAMQAEHNFTANAAHELRTPLAAVRIQAQVAERAASAVSSHEALQQLGLCVERASRMVDQLLTLSRFESMPVGPGSMVAVQMDQIVSRVLNELRPLLVQGAVELVLRTEPVTVFGLEHGVLSLVRNLVENALRYVPKGGVIRVETWQDGCLTYFAVEDSGPGIPADQRELVFEPFYRIAGDGVEGCGIGLSIVRSVVRLHKGEISLSDSALGGLRVVVRLPGAGVLSNQS